jgi:hypothetical protein
MATWVESAAVVALLLLGAVLVCAIELLFLCCKGERAQRGARGASTHGLRQA